MPDPLDAASEREARFRDDALAAQQRRAGLDGKTVADSRIECRVCSEPIPEARREAVPGVQTCVDCQFDIERACRAFSMR